MMIGTRKRTPSVSSTDSCVDCSSGDSKRRWWYGALLCLVLSIAPSAQAAIVGDTVVFDNFSIGLWGTPSVSGDELRFAPTEFRASAIGGPDLDFVAAKVEFDIMAQPGYLITGLSFREGGDSFLLGDGITEVDGTLIAGSARFDLDFSGTGNRFEGPGGTNTDRPVWEATALVDFGAAAVDSVHIVLENEFLALALGALDVADIDKDLALLQVDTAVIPLPPAFLLFGSALGLLASAGRRRLSRTV